MGCTPTEMPDRLKAAKFVNFVAKVAECYGGDSIKDSLGNDCIVEWTDGRRKLIAFFTVDDFALKVVPIWSVTSLKGVAALPLPGFVRPYVYYCIHSSLSPPVRPSVRPPVRPSLHPPLSVEVSPSWVVFSMYIATTKHKGIHVSASDDGQAEMTVTSAAVDKAELTKRMKKTIE